MSNYKIGKFIWEPEHINLFKEGYKDIEGIYPDQFTMKDIQKNIVDNYHGRVLLFGKKPVGLTLTDLKSSAYRGAELFQFYISPEHREKWFGSILLTHTLKDLMEREIKLVFADVQYDNKPTLSLLKKFGFNRIKDEMRGSNVYTILKKYIAKKTKISKI